MGACSWLDCIMASAMAEYMFIASRHAMACSIVSDPASNCLQVPNVEHFLSTYNMQCPMAAKRLIHSGIPATLEHGQARWESPAESLCSQACLDTHHHCAAAPVAGLYVAAPLFCHSVLSVPGLCVESGLMEPRCRLHRGHQTGACPC